MASAGWPSFPLPLLLYTIRTLLEKAARPEDRKAEACVGGVRRKNIQIAITTLLGGIFHPGPPLVTRARTHARRHARTHTVSLADRSSL